MSPITIFFKDSFCPNQTTGYSHEMHARKQLHLCEVSTLQAKLMVELRHALAQ